jgi:hypothetical protein
MSQVLRLSKEILQVDVMKQDKQLACIRAKGYAESGDIWTTVIGENVNGLPFYTDLFNFISSGLLTTITKSGGIATLGIISRINPAALRYDGATYSGIKKSRHAEHEQSYSYDIAAQALTCHLIRSLAHELEVCVVEE